MNELQAEQIRDTTLQNQIEASINELEDEFEVVFEHDVRLCSFEAAKHLVNALALEQKYRKGQIVDYRKFDLFKVVSEAPKDTLKEEEDQNVLKIENKAELMSFPEILVFTSAGNVCKVQNLNYSGVPRIIEKCDMEQGEKPIYIVGTKYYNGFLIAAFENGKVAKISMKSYATEFNRKKLKNAFNTESKLVFIEHIESDTDYAAISNIKKVMVFNTSLINAVDSRTTKGVQVMKSKDFSKMWRVKRLEHTKLSDVNYYRNENLNVVGYYLREGDEF